MLHIKFQGHRPFGSGEEDFFKVFTIYGHGGHLGHVTVTIWKKFSFPYLKEAPYEIWLQSAQWFQKRRGLKMLTYNTHTYTHTHIRTIEAYLYYKLTNEPKGSGELKINYMPSKYEPGLEKMCPTPYANNKGADQPAHPRSLISAFVVRYQL